MKPDYVKEIALLDKAIDMLEQEIELKDEFIQAQEKRLKMLEDHNGELTKLIKEMLTFQPEQKG